MKDIIRLMAVLAIVCGCLGVNAQTQEDNVQGNHLSQPSTPTHQPSTYSDFFLEAMVQRQQGNSDAAFDLLQHCIDINPKASEAYYFLSQYYKVLKDNDKAMEMVKRAVALEPDNITYT